MSDDILDLIDGALGDYALSEDAMRWAPNAGDDPDEATIGWPPNEAADWIERHTNFRLDPWQRRLFGQLTDPEERTRRTAGTGVRASNVRTEASDWAATYLAMAQHYSNEIVERHGLSGIFEWSPSGVVNDERTRAIYVPRGWPASQVLIDEVSRWIPWDARPRRRTERAERMARMHTAYRRRRK